MPSSPHYRFRKNNRVLKRRDFLAAYERGHSYRRSCAHVFIMERDEAAMPTRLGITATRKVGNAVKRNQLKRIAREVFRLALPSLKSGHTVIINFHRSALEAGYHAIERQLWSVWREAGIVCDEAAG